MQAIMGRWWISLSETRGSMPKYYYNVQKLMKRRRFTIGEIDTYFRGSKMYLRIDNTNVGYINAYIEGGMFHMSLIVIYERFRRRGIASEYVKYLSKYCTIYGLSMVHEFWEKMGAEIDIDGSFIIRTNADV